MKRNVYLLMWVIVFGFALWIGLCLQVKVEEQANTQYSIVPLMYFEMIFPIVIGILLRLPQLFKEMRNKVSWSIDWMKLIIIGLPSLYITLLPLLRTTFHSPYLPFSSVFLGLANTFVFTITGMVFGYVVVDCLKKGPDM